MYVGVGGFKDGNVDSCQLTFPDSLLVSNGILYIGDANGVRKLPFISRKYIM